MNLKGQRKSKNIEDIRKQKPSLAVTVTPTMGGSNDVELAASQVSKKNYPKGYMKMTDSKKLIKKGGATSMDGAYARDELKNREYTRKEEEQKKTNKEIDDLLKGMTKDKPEDSGPPKPKGLQEWKGPTQLSEIWTPRPLKK